MITAFFLSLSLTLFNQNPLLVESFTSDQFPPLGWDTLHSDLMTAFYRYTYTWANPDSFQTRQRVYDAVDTLRTGWSSLLTSVLDLHNTQGPESLFFWFRFSNATNNMGPGDTMYIDITNDQVTWFNLMKIDNTGAANVWDIARINLLPYDNFNNCQIRFHYVDQPNGSLGPTNCNFWLDSVKVLNYYLDTLPPHVDHTYPALGDTQVGVSSNILIYFDESLDSQTVKPEAFEIRGHLSGLHSGTVTYNGIDFSVQFNPNTNFFYAETIYVTVFDTIKDLSGNRLDGDNNGLAGGNYAFWFYTALSADTIPPAAVNNLSIVEIGDNSVKMRWTAPGDDGNAGKASLYDLRYATFNITEGNFSSATECVGEPNPSIAGNTDSFTVTGLMSQTRYYFGLKTADEEFNWSFISNVPSCTTLTTLETLLVLNELLVNPEAFDHNNNGNLGDNDEEFIELFNKDLHAINLAGYRIKDKVGTNTLFLPTGFTIPAFGYLVLYASGEGYVISGDLDTVVFGNWSGSWTNLDQIGDTIRLEDNLAREIDHKGYTGAEILADLSLARQPNGSETWINNAFPTPGRNNGEEYIWPIVQAFRDLDSNYIPDLLDSLVTITGIITAPPEIFSSFEAYVQDNSGGVCLYLYNGFPIQLIYGDSIIATGKVNQYNGKNELSDLNYSIIKHDCLMPQPVEIDGRLLNTEYYECALVAIRISYIDAFLMEASQSYTAWDLLNNPFTVWIDSYTNIPGHLAPLDSFTLTGIKGQYSNSSPLNDGYQLMPRDTFDFSHLFRMPAVKTIAEIQSAGADGVSSKYVDSTVMVEGVITGPDYVFGSGTPSFYIQDATGGINIYDAQGDEKFNKYIDSLGAKIRVVGQVTEYKGLTEIGHGYGWFISLDTLPLPKELGTSRFITEGMESNLIRFSGVIKTAPYKSGDGYNFEVLNGDCAIDARFTSQSGINPLTIKKDEAKRITGIAGQYDPEAPYTTGYQVLLRTPGDLELPQFDSVSSVPMLEILGYKTFIPSKGEQAKIKINAPLNYWLELNVYDMSGRVVKKLYDGAGGPQTIYWNGRDDYLAKCKIGIYLLNLKANGPDGKSIFKRTLIVLGTEF